VDLREYDKRELRRRIGLVQQDVFLFSGSILDNVTLWNSEADFVQRAKAILGDLDAGGLSSEAFLSRELEERGGNLSMGQRQVVAFARAAVRTPELWILDEATANIDVETESRVDRALRAGSSGKTCLIVAHRLATVRDAEQILVLQRGTLIERGTHEELVRLGWLYARLYRYQNSIADGAPQIEDGQAAAQPFPMT
jgi:ATP-binding cassette subfamily B protein